MYNILRDKILDARHESDVAHGYVHVPDRPAGLPNLDVMCIRITPTRLGPIRFG